MANLAAFQYLIIGLRFHEYTLRAETKVFFRVIGVGLLAVSLVGLYQLW